MNLSNHELVSKLKSLVKEEREITLEILKYLQEVEDRRLYALRGFSSLFAFCMAELGYEESATNRRISAMRMMRALPEIEAKIEDGSLNLSTVCQLQSFIKKEEKLEQKKLGLDEKKELLKVIENKSQRECEREFAKISPEIVKIKESVRAVGEDLTQITFTVTKEMMAEFAEIRELLSHKNVTGYMDLFSEMAAITLKKLRVKKPKSTAAGAVAKDDRREITVATKVMLEKPQELTAVQEVKAAATPSSYKRKYTPVEVRRTVWHRDQGSCQYVDPLTNRKCESRYRVQEDHITPLAIGGSSTPENLRLLCATHNRLMAIHFYGEKKMRPFLRL